MAGEGDFTTSSRGRYMIVQHENVGICDLFISFLLLLLQLQQSISSPAAAADNDDDDRWVIIVSVVVRKILAFFTNPMEWTGYFLDFLLNLFSLNGSTLLSLLSNFLQGKVVMPRRGSETFISSIGHLDPRIDLLHIHHHHHLFLQDFDGDDENIRCSSSSFSSSSSDQLEIQQQQQQQQQRALMDLSIMSSKLAYENPNVVRNVVNEHWKMHFVDFYDCWNDYQKERSTQVFIICDKPKDANLILISFRGTEPFDADDWITDFDYSWYEIPKVGKVHMGFLEALGLGNRVDTSTFTQLVGANNNNNNNSFDDDDDEGSGGSSNKEKKMSAYFGVRSKLKRLLREHKDAKFIVTGHSLGGALAILFPTMLVVHEEEEIMERLLGVYTYGQPRIGDAQVGKYMETHLVDPIPRYFRIVYCNDLVPRLPYDDKTFLYKHFGICLYYNSLYIQQKVEEEPNRNYYGVAYIIPDHMNAVWELIRSSIVLGYMYGSDYKEGWLSLMLRIFGLAFPGVSAHSPTDYVNSVRLARRNYNNNNNIY